MITTTDRLILRKFRETDADAVHAYARVMQKLGMMFEFLLERDYESKGVWVDSHLYALDLRSWRL